MTPSVARSGLIIMGTVCSSFKKSGRGKGSHASSSDVAVEVAASKPLQSEPPKTNKALVVTLDVPSSQLISQSTDVTGLAKPPLASRSISRDEKATLSLGLLKLDTPFSSTCSLMPPCTVPPSLSEVPCEMQNLLMGRWPVLPSPGSRVIRLFLVCEETDSQVERTWLYKKVFPELRLVTEKMGFHLLVVDVYPLQPTPFHPSHQITEIIRKAMMDSIDLWLIFLNGKLGWHLPTTIEAKDFEVIQKRLAEKSPDSAGILSYMYRLDENNVPPVYYLLAGLDSLISSLGSVEGPSSSSCTQSSTRSLTKQGLFDELSYIVTESQFETYFTEGLLQEVNTALSFHSSMMDNVLVVRRDITGLPKDRTHPANRQFLDVDSDGESHQQLLQRFRHLVTRVERIVSNECILKFTTPWPDMEQALNGVQTPYLKNLCQSTMGKLRAAVSRMVERQTSIDPYLAAGLPPVLCQELLMHAHKQQHLLQSCSKPRDFVRTAQEQLEQERNLPLILYGDVGGGLQTIAALLAAEEARRNTGRMVALRFMTLTPESQTIMAVLFTVLEQAAIAFGGTSAFIKLTDLTCGSLLTCLGSFLTNASVTIILCGVEWSKIEMNAAWLSETLHPNIRLVIVTCCSQFATLPCTQSLQVPSAQADLVREIFQTHLKDRHRCLTANQHSQVMAVLERAPLPVLAVMLASITSEWRSQDTINASSIPDTVKDGMIELLRQTEKVVGKICVTIIFGYLSVAKFGLSDSELQDILALDTKMMTALNPRRLPQVRCCPLSIWLYMKDKLSPMLDEAYLYGHRITRWQRLVETSLLQSLYNYKEETMHAHLADFFSGSWAEMPKHMPDPLNNQTMTPVPCSVIEQPNCYDRYTNCRKFLCLLHHMLQGIPTTGVDSGADVAVQQSNAARQHLLNLRWLVTKLDATSLVQLLDDLQMAINTAATISNELSWLQLLVARYATALSVSGLQLRTHMHAEIAAVVDKSPSKMRPDTFQTSIRKLDQNISGSSIPFLVFHKGPSTTILSTIADDEERPVDSAAGTDCCVNGFFSYAKDGKQVVSISTMAGEIMVWNTVSNQAIQMLKDINKPSDTVFLDSKRIVVLCNRELKAFDLESGQLVSNIRGMLNIKMPYFHVRDANTVIVLARNRMSVNVLDVNTGQIHATFKAGEDRFLNSLLVSGNGKMLVCGDETQKPSPLLVWELGQSKLLHDLRLPQHEFIPSIADITDNGHYVACACKGLYESANYFVVVYDLMSGQLYRQFRTNSSVTALSVTSGSQRVVMTLNDGSLAVYDILSGNCKHHLDGVKAIYNKVQHSTDEQQAVSYSINAGSMPIACTVTLWNIEMGIFLASYTFDSMVTCCYQVAHNNTLLVGLSSCRYYVVLSLHQKDQGAGLLPTPSSKYSVSARKVSDQQPLWRLVK